MQQFDDPKLVTPLKAMRLKCLECCAGSSNEVKACHMKDCPLWLYRFGKRPFRTKRKLTEEQKQELRKRAKKAHMAYMAKRAANK